MDVRVNVRHHATAAFGDDEERERLGDGRQKGGLLRERRAAVVRRRFIEGRGRMHVLLGNRRTGTSLRPWQAPLMASTGVSDPGTDGLKKRRRSRGKKKKAR